MKLSEARAIVAGHSAAVAALKATDIETMSGEQITAATNALNDLNARHTQASALIEQASALGASGAGGAGANPAAAISSGLGERVQGDPTGGFRTIGAMVQDITSGTRNERLRSVANPNNPNRFRIPSQFASGLAAARAGYRVRADGSFGVNATGGQLNTPGSDGGFMVAPDYQIDWSMRQPKASLNMMVRRPITTGTQFVAPHLKDNTNASGSVGGVTCAYKSEASAATKQTALFEDLRIDMTEYICYGSSSWLMSKASPALNSEIFSYFGAAMNNTFDNKIINGVGAGVPLGVLAAANANNISVTRTTANRVKAEDIANMISRISSLETSVWYATNAVKGQLLQLVIGSTLAGYIPQGALMNSVPFDMLLGRPVIYGDFGAALGTVGDLILINADKYFFPQLGTTEYAESMEFSFDTGEHDFRLIGANGGRLEYASLFTPSSGDTRADVVTIAS